MKFDQPAPDDGQFAMDAFASQIGKEIRVNLPDGSRQGRILAAKVAGDGRSVEFDLEVPGDLQFETTGYAPDTFRSGS